MKPKTHLVLFYKSVLSYCKTDKIVFKHINACDKHFEISLVFLNKYNRVDLIHYKLSYPTK